MYDAVTILTLVIVVSTIALIGAAAFGFDKGVLQSMGRTDFARGLITYLFAVVTIGIATVLVLSALTGADIDPQHEKRFQQGKEVLSLLLGLFGTIIGYYFGRDASSQRYSDLRSVQLSPLDISPSRVMQGGKATVRAVVTGGTPPFRFGVSLGSDKPEVNEAVAENNWVIKDIPMRDFNANEPKRIRVVVEDNIGQRAEQSAPLSFD